MASHPRAKHPRPRPSGGSLGGDSSLSFLNQRIVSCKRCPRLRAYCVEVAAKRKREFLEWEYWGRPLPGFGDPSAELLIVGLAPAAHGGLRTGRMFCGDSSGSWLAKALYQTGFANQPTSTSRDDGFRLSNAYVTAVVRCAPPDNKPSRQEIEACLPYLRRELELLTRVRLVIVLGRIAFDGYLRALSSINGEASLRGLRFAHGAVFQLGKGLPTLMVSYHPSRQNTQTGRLTAPMLDAVLARVRQLAEAGAARDSPRLGGQS